MCGACRRYEKTFEAIKYELPDYEFINYDIDQNRDKFEEYQVTGMPTTIVIENGVEKKRIEGYMTVEELNKFVFNEKL